MIRDQTARCHVISNAQSLINVCKGKNIIVSSGCEKEMELRGPYDVANLALLFDLKEFQAKDALSINCRSVLMHGKARKTARSVLSIAKVSTLTPHDSRQDDEAGGADTGPPAKRKKFEAI
ncbi:Ribonuclease P protein subunit p30 [Lamellibrachia satsuma]|nr:Ribonuclease P protein subunit p30 [Lamellibrachia satsuma]